MSAQPTALLYREFFTPAERRLLDSTPITDALSEIYLYRHLLRSVLSALPRRPALSLKSHVRMLAALGEAGLILASLVRFHWRTTLHRGSLDPELADLAALPGEPI